MIRGPVSRLGAYELLHELPSQRYITSYLANRMLDPLGPELVVHLQDEAGPGATDWLARVQRLVGCSQPNVAPILDVGAIDGRGFVVTTFVEGRHLLQTWVRHGAVQAHVPLEICAHIAREACQTLVQTPELIRDLGYAPVTLADVIVSSTGEVMLDIGVACLRRRAAQDAPHLKMYLSPEELRGRAPDARSAVYSVAILLWQFLTGQLLFPMFGRWIPRREERDIDIGKRPLIGVIPPSYLRESVPKELDSICVRALKTNPRRRYAGCDELAAVLDRFLLRSGWKDGQARLAEFMTRWFGSDFAQEREQRTALRPLKPQPPSA
jgi:serine/threonine protein kinase